MDHLHCARPLAALKISGARGRVLRAVREAMRSTTQSDQPIMKRRRPLLPLPPGETLTTRLAVFWALREMELGQARRQEWEALADAVNIVKALCELGRLDGDRLMPLLMSAQLGMVKAVGHEDGQMHMDEDELLAMREVVTVYEDAIRRLAAQTMASAMQRVALTVASAREARLLVEPGSDVHTWMAQTSVGDPAGFLPETFS